MSLCVFTSDGETRAVAPDSSQKGGGVRWDMVAVGVGVMVLLLVVLGISGVVTYTYRNTHKSRERRLEKHYFPRTYTRCCSISLVSPTNTPVHPQ